MEQILNEEIAKKLIASFRRCREELDSAELIIREIENEELRLAFKKIIGHVSLELYTQAMGQVFQFHPDLDRLGLFDPNRDNWEKQ